MLRGGAVVIRTISHTEIQAALTCEARWDFGYGDVLAGSSLKRRSIAPKLSDGRAWGAAVAAWHAYRGHDDLLSIYDPFLASAAAHAALDASYAADIAKQQEAGVHVPVEAEVERVTRLHELLTHYMQTAERLSNLTQLEGRFEVPLPSRRGRQRSNRYRFEGRIDGYTEGAGEWVVEFKLRDSLTPRQFLDLNRQHLEYAWARSQMTGQPVAGVIIDERWNELPKPAKRVVKSRKKGSVTYRPSADVSELTSEDSYLALCAELGEPEGHELKLAALQTRRWQQRVEILFRPGQLEEAGHELVSAAAKIGELDAGARYPLRVGVRHICSGCPFVAICPNPMDQLFVDSLFERVPPKRERPKEAQDGISG